MKEIIENGITYLVCEKDGKLVYKMVKPQPIEEEPTTEPTQLDVIEEEVKRTHNEIIDEYTLDLVESGVIE